MRSQLVAKRKEDKGPSTRSENSNSSVTLRCHGRRMKMPRKTKRFARDAKSCNKSSRRIGGLSWTRVPLPHKPDMHISRMRCFTSPPCLVFLPHPLPPPPLRLLLLVFPHVLELIGQRNWCQPIT